MSRMKAADPWVPARGLHGSGCGPDHEVAMSSPIFSTVRAEAVPSP